MLLVPLLSRRAGLPEKKAFATCVCVILPLSLVSAGVYLLRVPVDLSAAWPYLAGGLAGGILAGRVFRRLPTGLLRRLLALLILYAGVRYLFF